MQCAFSPLGTTKISLAGPLTGLNQRASIISLPVRCVKSKQLSAAMCGRSGSQCRGICLCCSPAEVCEACNGSALLGRAQRGGGARAGRKGDGWRDGRTVARNLLETPSASLMRRRPGIYAAAAAGSGSRIYLDALRYHGEMRFQSVVPV